jgi:RNA polymerase primary sigma factor
MKQLKINQRITNRSSDSISKYFSEINKIPLLTNEEELALAKKARNGDAKSIQKLITHNLKFVVSVAKQYQNQGISLEDLINEGNLGLIRAAQKFDESRGFKFISYAVWWIRQGILQTIAENGKVVRMPINKVRNTNKVNFFFENFVKENHREPSAEELQKYINDENIDVREAFVFGNKTTSMESNLSHGEDNFTLTDILVDESEDSDKKLNVKLLSNDIEKSLSTLNKRQKEIVCMYFGLFDAERKTLEEIGKEFGLTRERVRQIKDGAIRTLRMHDTSSLLKNYY